MDPTSLHEAATKQLDRVLGFFSRVEAKASLLFAVNTGTLALLAINLKVEDFAQWYLVVPAAITIVLVGASLWFLYRCSFPHLKGGAASLIYFREIAARTEASFIKAFRDQSSEDYISDVLGQVWRNSEILKLKFDAVKVSFILTGLSLLPWLVFVLLSTIVHAHTPSFK